jgi:glycosyltransferase involved in cell wall biosynthesis
MPIVTDTSSSDAIAERVYGASSWEAQPVRVSGVLITYNHERFIQAAISSALSQTYPMDLIISDDGSTDRTPALIRSTLTNYKGCHRVRVRYGSRNLGICGNQNASIQLAEGELIVLFEGDDESVPERTTKIVDAYVARKRRIAALESAIQLMDCGGRIGTVVWPTENGALHGCGLSFRRDVFFEIGPISKRLMSGDIALWMRAAFVPEGGTLQVRAPLVHYRVHDTNASMRLRWDFSSVKALRECCSNLVKHEVAKVFELRKIRGYRRRLGAERDDLQSEWETLFHLSRARARLVLAVSRRSRLYWVWPALVACKFPVLKGKALRVIAVALFPWIRGLYKFALAKGQRVYA